MAGILSSNSSPSVPLIILVITLLAIAQASGAEDAANLGVSWSSAFGSITRRTLLDCRDPNPYLRLTLDTAGPLASVQTVVATVSGVLQPSSRDWIGVFSEATHNYSDCPANAALYLETGDFSSLPLLCDYPLKFKFLSDDPGYMNCSSRTCITPSCSVRTCSGSLAFRLVNIRTPVNFVLFTGGLVTPCILKISRPLSFARPEAPLYGHLSLKDSSGTSMVLTWISKDNGTQNVEYDGRSSTSEITTFDKKDMCGAAAKDFGWHTPGYMHHATMTNLSPGISYSYRYGSPKVGWSEAKNFTTPPTDGSNSVNLIVFGDMGKAERDNSSEHYIQPGALQVIDSLANQTVDAIFHIGDISYATGFLAEWDHFLEMIEPVASRIPYMTAIGNHERDHPGSGSLYNNLDSGGECGVPYRSYFRMPEQGIDKPWYSIEIGPVHLTVISTEHDWTPKSEQYSWMEHDLASVNRTHTPWLVFAGHRPMYSTQGGLISRILPGVDPEFVAAVEPLLVSSKVDLALWGHVHNYERTCAVNQSSCVQIPAKDDTGVDVYVANGSAPIHAVVGMAGFSLDHFPANWSSWSLVRISSFGYSRISADKTELLFEFITAKDGARADQFKIVRKH